MTPPFLEETVDEIRADLRSGEYDRGVPAAPSRPPPSLRAAIERERPGGALLVEYKRASPGAARPLPPPRSLDEFVRATDGAGVAAYSCLATRHGFDGAPARVAELARRTARPVLFKEFVIDPAQLGVAARTGAAAVLLIARLESAGLLQVPLRDLAGDAHRLGLEVLLELHDPAELSRLDGVGADVYGVNTRDLSSLRLDRPTAFATLARCRQERRVPLLGLSGVEGPADAQEFWNRGCDGLLVGSAVARASEPSAFLASLRRPPAEANP
jgi:indole-3-glycerol phosphate synthase